MILVGTGGNFGTTTDQTPGNSVLLEERLDFPIKFITLALVEANKQVSPIPRHKFRTTTSSGVAENSSMKR